MGGNAYNSFYASAARSMSENWKAFLFGSFSPANTITIDKIPGYLWPQALSARLFGFHSWSLVLPQIIEAVVTLLVTYRLVRRWAGEGAAVLAAAFLALTPALIAATHTNNEEAAYVMCLTLAASAAQRSVASGRLRSLVLAGVWVGLAFQCKMVEAWAIVPAIAATYLIAAPPKMLRRLLHVLAAMLVMLAVSLAWVVTVALVPAHSRPYIDGTTNNNPFSMVFGYNALTRFGSLGINPASVGAVSQAHGAASASAAAGAVPSSGLATTFEGGAASQVGWLYPLAAVSILVLLWQRRGRSRTDPIRAGVILFTIWIVIYGLAYSAGTIHTYYVVTLAPPLAALCGAGTVALWRAFRAGGRRAWALPITLALTDAWAIYIAAHFPTYRNWLIPLLAVAGIAALIALALVGRRPAVTQRAALAAVVIGLVAVMAGPAAWDSSVITAGNDTSLAMGNIGPSAPGAGAFGGPGGARGTGRAGFGTGGSFGAGGRAGTGGGFGAAGAGAGTGAAGSFGGAAAGRPSGRTAGRPAAGGTAGRFAAAGGFGGMWVGDGALTVQQRDVLDYAQTHRDGARFVLTVTTTFQATPYILRAGADVLSMGGFSGQVPYPTLTQFEQYVASGQVRYVDLPASGAAGGFGGAAQAQGQQSAAAQIQAWVPAHCSPVPASAYADGTASSATGTLYLCSGS